MAQAIRFFKSLASGETTSFDENVEFVEEEVEELLETQDDLIEGLIEKVDQEPSIFSTESRTIEGFHECIEIIGEESKGAWAKKTLNSYRSAIKQYISFLNINLRELADSHKTPNINIPYYIVAWINFHCEAPKIDSENGFLRERKNLGWSNAMIMRAAMSYYYVHELKFDHAEWNVTEGIYWGNPVKSTIVSRYMKSLERRKAQAGEKPESVKAMESRILKELYVFNAKFPFTPLGNPIPSTIDGHRPWAGFRKRIMMSLIYAISFQLFLRIDETLSLQVRHLRIIDKYRGIVEIRVDQRKSAQTGEIQPFIVYSHPEEPWFDIPALLALWFSVSSVKDGYIFRPFNANDMVILDNNKKPTYTTVLNDFRDNLHEISEEPGEYGCHSFRRGGVQYFSDDKRWSVRKLCAWGGWSTNFSNTTIARYLVGRNDDFDKNREDFMNPESSVSIACSVCGRNCDHDKLIDLM